MSERMNKERARENIIKLKEVVEQYNKMIVPPQKECSVYIGEDTLYLNDEMLESLDIAIDSLDNEWVDVRDRLPSEKDIDVLVTIYYKNFDETEVDLRSTRRNLITKEIEIEEHAPQEKIIAWKPLPKPYERKE